MNDVTGTWMERKRKKERKHIRKRCVGTVNPLKLTMSDAIGPETWPDL